MFGFLKAITKTAFDVATLPVAVVEDVATMCDGRPSKVEQQLKRIPADLEDVRETLEN